MRLGWLSIAWRSSVVKDDRKPKKASVTLSTGPHNAEDADLECCYADPKQRRQPTQSGKRCKAQVAAGFPAAML